MPWLTRGRVIMLPTPPPLLNNNGRATGSMERWLAIFG